MKKTYNQPTSRVYQISTGLFIAASDRLQRGIGSGGNTAEARDMLFEFDDEEE